MIQRLDAERLWALFIAGWLALNFPLIGLWNRGWTVLGIPLLPVALFAGWALLIAMLAWMMESGSANSPAHDEP